MSSPDHSKKNAEDWLVPTNRLTHVAACGHLSDAPTSRCTMFLVGAAHIHAARTSSVFITGTKFQSCEMDTRSGRHITSRRVEHLSGQGRRRSKRQLELLLLGGSWNSYCACKCRRLHAGNGKKDNEDPRKKVRLPSNCERLGCESIFLVADCDHPLIVTEADCSTAFLWLTLTSQKTWDKKQGNWLSGSSKILLRDTQTSSNELDFSTDGRNHCNGNPPTETSLLIGLLPNKLPATIFGRMVRVLDREAVN